MIVGIGASAGGLAAIERFLAHAPVDANIAYVIVQHLEPTHESILPELIARVTKMTVSKIEDRTLVEPNRVYTIPPGKDLSILHGVLHTFDIVADSGIHMPIDTFLWSLAEDRAESAVGVILSGTGSDGTRGLRAIKERAGLALAQDPATAQFAGMPRSAIDEGLVDIVAAPEELAAKILEYRVRAPLLSRTDLQLAASQAAIDKVVILLRSRTGNDFSLYKKSTLYRRIERRMGIHGITSADAYASFAQQNPIELDLLFKELLIGVTSFFRDRQAWEALSAIIVKALLDRASPDQGLRAWSVGCSTGEEAYSLAIAFREAQRSLSSSPARAIKVFATDLDSEVIARARQGYYSESAMAEVPSEVRERYFVAEDGGFRVRTEIREMVVFAPQNLIADPPFTRLDLVCCRNLLIYLTPAQQRRIIPLLHYSLNPGGFLFLGSAESIGAFTDLFFPLDIDNRIYRRKDSPRPILVPGPASEYAVSPEADRKNPAAALGIQDIVDRVLLRSFAPAAVLTGPAGDIMYISGNINRYISMPAGKANLNIFALAKKKLSHKLEVAFAKSLGAGGPVTARSIEIEGERCFVDMTVQALEEPEEVKGCILVVFAEAQPPRRVGTTGEDARAEDLESQLADANEELRILRERMRDSHEKLSASNEELQSANEELQSTNEELMTSREEMQSLNEELQTVNSELQARVDELIVVGDDVKELLDSTDISMVFLDEALRVKRFTKRAAELTRLIPADIGRAITDIASDLIYPELPADSGRSLAELAIIEREIRSRDGAWFLSRIMPHRTRDQAVDGLVIVFSDISRIKSLESALGGVRAPEGNSEAT
jgi:chemotaxis methyl-accepting protein methylase/PAS domain-containing protein